MVMAFFSWLVSTESKVVTERKGTVESSCSEPISIEIWVDSGHCQLYIVCQVS